MCVSRSSWVTMSVCPVRKTRKPTPPSLLIMISAPLGWRISRICLLIFWSSAGGMPLKMPTGFKSIRASLEQVRELLAQELAPRFLVVGGHQFLDALIPGVGERFRGMAGRQDRFADHDLDPFAKPQVFRARQRGRADRHAGLDREMGEPFLERQELPPRLAPCP